MAYGQKTKRQVALECRHSPNSTISNRMQDPRSPAPAGLLRNIKISRLLRIATICTSAERRALLRHSRKTLPPPLITTAENRAAEEEPSEFYFTSQTASSTSGRRRRGLDQSGLLTESSFSSASISTAEATSPETRRGKARYGNETQPGVVFCQPPILWRLELSVTVTS